MNQHWLFIGKCLFPNSSCWWALHLSKICNSFAIILLMIIINLVKRIMLFIEEWLNHNASHTNVNVLIIFTSFHAMTEIIYLHLFSTIFAWLLLFPKMAHEIQLAFVGYHVKSYGWEKNTQAIEWQWMTGLASKYKYCACLCTIERNKNKINKVKSLFTHRTGIQKANISVRWYAMVDKKIK